MPKRIPVEEIVRTVEEALKNLPQTVAEEVRQDVAVTLRKYRPLRCNVSTEEREAFRKLRADKSCVFLLVKKRECHGYHDYGPLQRKDVTDVGRSLQIGSKSYRKNQ